MLEMLQSRPRVTGAELAAALGVDERTVRRYASTLADIGIPVTATRGRYGGYRLDPDQRIPPLLLTDNEAVAVVLGLAAADHLGMANEAPATAVALAKVHRLLPTRLATRLAVVQQAVGFPLRPRPAGLRAGSPTLLALGAATRERRRVALSYRTGHAAERLQEVDPYGLVFHSGRWFVVGREHPGGEINTFRVDRIGAVDVQEATFAAPEGFDAVGHVDRTRSQTARDRQIEVLLETDVAGVRERLPDHLAELTETANGVLLRGRVTSLAEVAAVLAGLGCPFTIVRPAELRAAVMDHARRLAGYAQRTAPVG
jgi:predicted DNA-binding transcriptional regulator YafY